MLKNFFKIIFRDLSKDKVYTTISILGLSAGIAVSIIIIAVSFSFLSRDKFHAKGDRIYQAYFKNDFLDAGVEYSNTMPYLLGEAIKNNYPEVADAATIMSDSPVLFIAGEKKSEQTGCYSESSLFNIFSFHVVAQSTEKILPDNNSIAISRTVAEKYFGSVNDAVGKNIILRRAFNKKEVYVSAVFNDMPDNSTLKFEYVLPLQSRIDEWEWMKNWPWGNYLAATYFELKPNVNLSDLNRKIKNFVSEKNPHTKAELFLFKYENIFLKGPGNFDKTNTVRLLFVIAVVIIGIASINFINMATSRAARKNKEIGLRKVIGAGRNSLILRFLAETYLLSFVSILLGLLITELLLPYINTSFNGFIIFSIPYNNIYFDFSLVALWFLVGIFSGLYPSLYLSSLSPSGILTGSSVQRRRVFVSKFLITIQFAFSTIFIFIAVVVTKQMKYITDKDLGLNINQTLQFPITTELSNHLSSFTNDLKLNPAIVNVTYSNFEPTGVYASTSDPKWEGKPEALNDMFPVVMVSDNYLNTFDVQLSKGRNFFEGDSADITNYLINEKMEKIIGKDSPIGLKLSMWGNDGQIIGVIKNFHIGTLMEEIKPLIIMKKIKECNLCFVKINPADLSSVVSFIEKTYNEYEKEYPLKYSFLDEQFLNRHSDAKIFVGFFRLFSAIAIIISCLGLFGLTAFTVQQKTKEVGVRKVLGASFNSITMLITKSLIKLVLIASLIALPVGYYLSGKILQMFVYKTDIGVEIYLLSVAVVTLLASGTIAFQAIKAASANPVESLRYE